MTLDPSDPLAEVEADRQRFHDAVRAYLRTLGVAYLPHVLVVEGDRLLQAGIRLGERLAHERPTIRAPDLDELPEGVAPRRK